MSDIKTFDPLKVDLGGTNLVEASAGTGKTYSIAILFLRLVVEEKLPIEKILVVTYTRPATAELKDRIRYFLSEAVHAFEKGTCREDAVTELIEKFRGGDDRRERLALLQEAILWLDESSVFTIHGFCQRVLGDSAFETGEPYETEMILDQSELLKEAVMDFYRKNIVTADPLLFRMLDDSNNGIDDLVSFASAAQSRHLVEIRYPENFQLSHLAEVWSELREIWKNNRGEVREIITSSPDLKRNKDNFKADILDAFFEEIDGSFQSDAPAVAALKKLTRSNIEDQTKSKKEPPEHAFFDRCEEFFEIAGDALYWFRGRLLLYLRDELPRRKREQNVQFFDDLLMRLYKVLKSSDGEVLINTLRNQYRSALIDEFQDTDPVQYYIFNTIFNYRGGSLFLIGDPKQSIYGFRGADIFAYMEAARAVTSRHTLETNWRSESPLVQAFNELFQRKLPFLYDEIGYEAVKASWRADASPMTIEGKREKPMVVWNLPEDDAVSKTRHLEVASRAVVSEILRLLHADTRIGERRLVPGDIAILVQTWRQGHVVKQLLAEWGVPAIMNAVASVFDTMEAGELYRCLKAIAQPGDEGVIRGALSTSLLGVPPEEIFRFNNEDELREFWQFRFRELNRLWEQRGFMVMFTRFMKENDLASRTVAHPEGERRLTNILHIMELLHRRSAESGSGMHHLLRWFGERLTEINKRNEEYEQRLESDANALSIVTIHRSKGLQYPVLFCPFLHEEAKPRDDDTFIYHEQQKEILQIGKDNPEGLEIARGESLAEQLRLFYVAVTRAEHRCYLLRVNMKHGENCASHYFLHDAPGRLASSEVISLEEIPAPPAAGYQPSEEDAGHLQCRNFTGKFNNTWKITSFSALTAERHGEDHGRSTEAQDRDPFSEEKAEETVELKGIHAFAKGPRAGTALHQIFEEIDFTEGDHREKINEILTAYSLQGEDAGEVPVIDEMVRNVLSASLPGRENFSLREITMENRLTEMEFYFPLKSIEGSEFAFIDEGLTVNPSEGFIRGFIDSIVCHGGRYYIIDWKSNFLGGDESCYGEAALAAAMRDHRYTLQYLLYTVALDRFLAARIEGYSYDEYFGGVFYVFLRGVQEGTSRGIFFARPGLDEIQKLSDMLCR